MKRSSIASAVYVLGGAGLVAAYLLVPPSRSSELLVAGAPALAAITIVIAMFVHRPVRPVPWVLLAVGLLAGAVARLIGASEWYGDEGLIFPGAAQAFGLLAYPSLFVGAIFITSRRRQLRDLLAGAEPIIYAIALTALTWLAVTGPYIEDDSMPLSQSAWIWVFPFLSGLLALIVVRRVGRASSSGVFEVLVFGFLASGIAEVAIGWAMFDADFEPGNWLAASPMLGPLVIGFVVTLPGMSEFSNAKNETVRIHWSQIFGLLFSSVIPLAAMVLMLAAGLSSVSSFIVVSVATVSVIGLALGRMWRLVDEVRLLTEQRSRDRLAAMVEHSSDVVLLADPEGRINYASPGLRATLGYDPESWSGRHLLDVVAEDEREDARRQLDRLVAFGSGGTVDFEASLAHADGQYRRASIVFANLVGSSAIDGIVATFRDVTEQRNLERQLSHRAFHDELTGLANRALFLDRMDHALRVTRPEADPVVVLFVDLDDFKMVNDALGHSVGDQTLRAVAERIRRAAGTGDTAARLGGDEFAVLLEDRGGIDRAIDGAERLLDELRDPISIAGYEVAALASVGVAVAAPGMSTTSLLRDADIAMYEAKRAGKGQIRLFDPAMRLVATRHLEYRSELGDAIDNGELRLVFMPFVDLNTGQVTGAEGLIRWDHPEHGDIPASEFVPIAERSGLIVPMGYWAIEEGIGVAASWRPESGLFLSLNVSAVQIRQADFVERVIDIVNRRHADPRNIMFEIAETVLVDESDRADQTVSRLRDEGFRFAVDAFGSGYSSLSHLQRHPLDLLKLDRAVIAQFGADPRGDTLVRAILQMAEALDLVTVAEGIENTTQLRELRRLGCDLGQGYLLSKPIESDEVTRRFGRADVVPAG